MNDNVIFVIVENNNATLHFEKYNIHTPAFFGKNGLTDKKQEGDKKTPIGEFSLGLILGTHSKINNPNYNYIKINKNLYWVDDIKSKHYNKLIDIQKVKKDWNSAEHLIDFPIQYEYLIEVKTNPKNIPNKGSAIFLHCSKNAPTKGCIAIDRKVMKKLINLINPSTKIIIKEK